MKTTLMQRGLTLVEHLAVLAVVALTLGASLPRLEALTERRRLEAAAAQLETELQYARSLAVARNETVRVRIESGSDASCYVMHTGDHHGCTCAGGPAPVCRDGALLLRSARFETGGPLAIRSNAGSLAFGGDFGTVTPTATIELRNPRGEAVRLIVNVMGRVRSCATAAGQPAQPAC